MVRWQCICNICDWSHIVDDPKEDVAIRSKAPRFFYNAITWILYHCSFDGILLWCLSYKEAHEPLKEAHDGMYGAHQPGPMLGDQLSKLGYFWLKMIPDATYAKWCHACQIQVTFFIKCRSVFIQHPPHGHLRCGEWMLSDQSVLQHSEDIASSWP